MGVIPARNTTLFKLHLLANPAHFWLRISELLLKMMFSLLCSRNLIPLREISRVNPIKIVPSVSIRSNLFEENLCKIFNDVLLVSNNNKKKGFIGKILLMYMMIHFIFKSILGIYIIFTINQANHT